jgi:hypothetical protein
MRDHQQTRYQLSDKMRFYKRISITKAASAVQYEIYEMGDITMAIGVACNDGYDLGADSMSVLLRHMEWGVDDLKITMVYYLDENSKWVMYHKDRGVIEFNSNSHRNEFKYVNNQLFLNGMSDNMVSLASSYLPEYECFGEIEESHPDCENCGVRNACAFKKSTEEIEK